MTVYLDCNATTPVDQRVLNEVFKYLSEEFGNAGSRTHDFGQRANKAVQIARERIANVVDASSDEIVFTSGATESNNISILGLADYGKKTGRTHIISTSIEHKAVLEPLDAMEKLGFEITLISPNSDGFVKAEDVINAIRKNTLLISVMHSNNETGVLQPIEEICQHLANHEAYFHVDAAQGFGKDIKTLKNRRIDLMSISGHKIFAPKGIGALVTRKRKYTRPYLKPLMYGGGQERGLRPGTLPVPLVVGLGLASDIAYQDNDIRIDACRKFKDKILNTLLPLNPVVNGALNNSLPNTINLSFPGIDSEALMLSLKDIVAISNGSACTSHSYQPSHVLKAMGVSEESIKGAVRLSWCHETEEPNWDQVVSVIKQFQ